jgi:tetratricopeptide (TPR) repeat protein
MTLARLLPSLALLAVSLPASAEFAKVDTEKVPVERLLKNLQESVDRNPKDAKAILNIARAHAMAFSLRSGELEVVSKDPDRLWFGYEPDLVPFNRVVPTVDPEKLKAAKSHLAAALKAYDDAIAQAPDDLIAQLGRAWLLTQTEKKSDAIEPLRKVIEKGWDQDRKAQGWFGSHRGIAAEAAGYLIPLLDAAKDKAEIDTARARVDEMNKLPRMVTPIAVPLRDGSTASDLENRAARVHFDADGSGRRMEWTWITRDAAWLVYDPRRSGRITSALQLFGNVSFWMFWETGYDALSALDDNHDGQLTGKELEGLALWQDSNGDGISDAGEVQSLSDYGVTAISCRRQRDLAHPDQIAWSPSGVTFRDGTTRPTYDLVLHTR